MALQETFLLFGKVPMYKRFFPAERPRIVSLGKYRNGRRRELMVHDEDTVSIREVGKVYQRNGRYVIDEDTGIIKKVVRRKTKEERRKYYVEHAHLYQDNINSMEGISSSGKIFRRTYAWIPTKHKQPTCVADKQRNIF